MTDLGQCNAGGLDFTGERFLPEVGGVIELEHIHRYVMAQALVRGKHVLDIASGEGYGSSILADAAATVVGVDIAAEAVEHAASRYKKGNLRYMQGSCAAIPLQDASVDVVVSFETIEHHDQHSEMFREISRVLRPGGVLLISSPDKAWYTDETGYSNPYHVKELYRDEFLDLVRGHFRNLKVYGQRVMYGSAILPESGCEPIQSHDIREPLAPAVPGVPRPLYLIAIASDGELPSIPVGIFEQPFYESEPFRLLASQYDGKIEALRAKFDSARAELVSVRTARNTSEQALVESAAKVVELEESLDWAKSEILRLRKIERSPLVRIVRAPGSIARRVRSSAAIERFRRRVRSRSETQMLQSCPLFDAAWYLEQNADVRASGMDPLRHYVLVGHKERRSAGPEFNDAYYMERYPDVAALHRPALWHFWVYGRGEGRYPNPSTDPNWECGVAATVEHEISEIPAGNGMLEFSVIIPTYNRKAMLPGVLEAWKAVDAATAFPYEIIFSDDGSQDGSVELLDQYTDQLPIKVLSNEHGGASHARNAAIRAAQGRRLLIIGDDIFPDPMLLNVHAELGRKYGRSVATLGVVDWHPELPVNHLMRHITEVGNEQFSYNRLKNGAFVDFRHFYTCNIALDRDFLLQERTIFDETFKKYGFEDIELGYRLSLRGMRIIYSADAKGDHYHPYQVASFCRRQMSAGEMSVVFRDMHPSIGSILGIETLQQAYDAAKTSGKVDLSVWESRRDWIVARCEFYEEVLTRIEGVGSDYIQEYVSELYSRLFRAMYEVGILMTTTHDASALAFALERNFPGKWQQLWKLMGKVERVTVDQVCQAVEAGAHNTTEMGPQAPLADLKLVRKLSYTSGSSLPVQGSALRLARRALHYLRHDPRYLMTRAVQMLGARAGANAQPRWQGDAATTPVNTIALILPTDAEHHVALLEKYRGIFGLSLVVYGSEGQRHIAARPLPADIGQLTESLVYCPQTMQSALSADHLYAAYLASTVGSFDLSLVSYDLRDDGYVRCKALQDQALFSARLFQHFGKHGTLNHAALRGKVLRMLPEHVQNAEAVHLDKLLGPSVTYEHPDCLIFRRGQSTPLPTGTLEAVPIPSAKPVVFVLPVFLAVGGVERNTVEIMRQLNDRYDFVVLTTERLRVEQGSLASQAAEVAKHVIELSETCAHQDYIGVLKLLKRKFQPSIVWICNGSPWLCDNLSDIRGAFANVPIVDQKAYDAELGWITRYSDEATRSLDRFIAINKKIYKRFIDDFCLDAGRVDLIYSAIDTRKFREFKCDDPMRDRVRADFGLPRGKPTLAFMGRLVPQKRPLEFLELARLRRDQDELYVLVGDGELSGQAEDFIRQHQLSNVVRIKYVANTPAFFSVVDGLVITSSYEGLPIAMLEAMAVGVPVLATDVGDIADVLADYDAGEVVPEANAAQALAARMDAWLTRSAMYRENLGVHRDDLLERFSSRSIAAQYETSWHAAMKQYGGASV